MSDEALLRETCVLLRETLEQSEQVREAWTGPRSTEVGFTTKDGREVRMSVIVRRVI